MREAGEIDASLQQNIKHDSIVFLITTRLPQVDGVLQNSIT